MDTNQMGRQEVSGSGGRRRRPLALAGLVGVLALVTSACTPSELANALSLLALVTQLLALLGGGA